MKTRSFLPGKTYKIVEIAQPHWWVQTKLLNAKIEFTQPTQAPQDQEGFLKFSQTGKPFFNVLSGPHKDQEYISLPVCRIRILRQRDYNKCTCPAWPFPHRLGSGDCSNA